MPISNYPGGFANGVTIRGVPLLMAHPGNVFWVDSGAGSNGNKGTFDKPFGTIDYAVGRCTANNGDILMVKPGHVETVTAAAGLDLDVAGIAIVGLGAGSNRPTVNFTTAVGADMDVDAANITVVNLLFTGGIDALTGPIDVNAADFSMINCETRDVTGQATDFIVTDANANRLYIDGWVHRGAAAAGADTAITIVGGDGAIIKNFWIDGNFAVACIENVTTAATNLSIYGDPVSFARTRNSADVIVTLVATATGNVGPNINARLQDNAANITEAFVGADMQFFQPINIVNLDGESSMQTNITASTDA
jgi:hypothetical protein